MLYVFLILLLLLVSVYLYIDLPKNYGIIFMILTFMTFLILNLLCDKFPKIPSFNSLKKISNVDRILGGYDTDMKLQIADYYTQSVIKNDSIFVIPSIVADELGCDDKNLNRFNLNRTFYFEINKNRNNDIKLPHGTIWGIYDGKSDPTKKLKQSHNSFISGYYWNYILVIPILFSLFHKRKKYIIKNLLAILLLVSAELLRLYYFMY
jgi:hypothetical protein